MADQIVTTVMEEFAREGIEIPYPKREILMRSAAEPDKSPAATKPAEVERIPGVLTARSTPGSIPSAVS